jgi:gliding motility-associated-like protein
MRAIIKYFLFLSLFWIEIGYGQTVLNDCTNLGFETGTFKGWQLSYGTVGVNKTTNPFTTQFNYIADGTFNNGHLITTGTGFDTRIPTAKLTLVAPGSKYSTRIGNSGTMNRYDRINTKFLVTNENTLFQYKFAVVLEDPSHQVWQQPRFSLKVLDDKKKILPCGFYEVYASKNIPGFKDIGTIRYLDWTTAAIDLRAYIGKIIEVEVTTNDCTEGGHFGYAYFDAQCMKSEITPVFYCNAKDSVLTLNAPDGFEKYKWSTGDSLKTISITNPIPKSNYSVIVTPFTSIVGACNLRFDFKIPDKLVYLQDFAVCSGDSIKVGKNIYKVQGRYLDTLASASGCDSTITTNLFVKPKSYVSLSPNICEGDTLFTPKYTITKAGIYYDTTSAYNSCDSFMRFDVSVIPKSKTVLNRTICEGSYFQIGSNTYNKQGTYYDTLQTYKTGCDSVLVYNLNFYPKLIGFQNIEICPGGTYSINNKTYTNPGNYIDTLTSKTNGCDSLLTTRITIKNKIKNSRNVEICEGTSFTFNNKIYYNAAVFTDTFTSMTTGCDSILTTNLSILPKIKSGRNVQICEGTSYVHNAINYTTAQVFKDTFSSIKTGCDSILTTNLTILPKLNANRNATFCEGTSYTFNNKTYTKAGIIKDTFNSKVTGCDSIVSTNLLELPKLNTSKNATFCEGTSYTFNNKTYTEAGIIKDTFSSRVTGCDSIVSTNLVELPKFNTSKNVTFCEGTSFTFNNKTYTKAGIIKDTFSSKVTGCDSIVSTNLVELPKLNTSKNATFCEGTSYTFNNKTYTKAGIIKDTFSSKVTGCDSIITTNLVQLQKTRSSRVLYICIGDSLYYQNRYHSKVTSFVDTLSSKITGCDSILTTTLLLNPLDTAEFDYEICNSEKIQIRDKIFSKSGNYQLRLKNSNSCDSVYNIRIKVAPNKVFYQNVTLCAGNKIQVADTIIKSAGSYRNTIQRGYPLCDSVIVTDLNFVNFDFNLLADTSIMMGDSVYLRILNPLKDSLFTFSWTPIQSLKCPSCQHTWAFPKKSTTYRITATYKNQNCENHKDVNVEVIRCRYFIPNVFSPNSDKSNDKFFMSGDDCIAKIKTMRIFNRWGELLFENNNIPISDPSVGWNGTQKGIDIEPQVLVYTFEIEYIDGMVDLISGDVTLVR